MSTIILGNGKSRENVDLSNYKHIYGCNLAYKEDIDFEWIVATDVLIQHEIYRNYTGQCLFLDWEPIPSEMAVAFEAFDTQNESNDYTEYGCVISGEGNNTLMTYLRKEDQVISVKEERLPFLMAAGSLAMWHAAETGISKIHLAGFGDNEHLHDQTLMDDNGRRLARWEQERKQIIKLYPDIDWKYL